jgi:hypothetical protein
MAFLRFIIWTSVCIALGIFSATVEFGDRTLYEHGKRAWEARAGRSQVDIWKDDLRQKIDNAKAVVALPGRKGPAEHHSDEDKASVNRLITKSK